MANSKQNIGIKNQRPSLTDKQKKILYITGGVLVVGVLAFIIYNNSGGDIVYDEGDDTYIGSEDYDEIYNPEVFLKYEDDFVLPESSIKFIDNYEISKLSLADTQMAINEIYARHGRNFGEEPYYSHFNNCEWYKPIYSSEEFSEEWFNDYERENIKVLAAYRKELKKEDDFQKTEESLTSSGTIDDYGIEYDTYRSQSTLFDETVWTWTRGQTLGGQCMIKMHSNGTFSAYYFGPNQYVEDAGMISFNDDGELELIEYSEWAIPAGDATYHMHKNDAGVIYFETDEEFPMQVGTGTYTIEADPYGESYF